MLTSYTTRVEYQNQEIDLGTIHTTYSDFTSTDRLVCGGGGYTAPYDVVTCEALWNHHHNQGTTLSHHKTCSSHLYSLTGPLPTFNSGNHSSGPHLCILSWMLYKWNNIVEWNQNLLWRLAFSIQHNFLEVNPNCRMCCLFLFIAE